MIPAFINSPVLFITHRKFLVELNACYTWMFCTFIVYFFFHRCYITYWYIYRIFIYIYIRLKTIRAIQYHLHAHTFSTTITHCIILRIYWNKNYYIQYIYLPIVLDTQNWLIYHGLKHRWVTGPGTCPKCARTIISGVRFSSVGTRGSNL